MWWKKNKWKVIVPVLIAAVLAAAFWYGGGAPGLQGWNVGSDPTVQTDGQHGEESPNPAQTDDTGESNRPEQIDSQERSGETEAPPQETQTDPVSPDDETPTEGIESRPGGTEGDMSVDEKLDAAAEIASGSSPGVQAGDKEYSESQGMAIDPDTGKDQYLTDPVPEGKPLPVEPQDVEISDTAYTCTISISCATILDHMDWLDPEKVELVPEDADICVCTDLDEVFHPGWRAALEAAWTDGTTQAVYRYTWNFNADGSEGTVFWIEKIHARRGYRWTHPVHEVLERQEGWGPGRKCTAEGVQLDHHADPAKSRGQYLPLLELSVAEAPEDDRNTHYLGREYLFYGRWDDCIRTLERHLSLPTAVWADERCASMRFLARAWRQKGRPEQARWWLWRAIGEAPHLREPYLELARLLYEEAEWDGVVYLCRQALAITDRPQTYICEAEAWGSLPWDLLSLGLYHTGRRGEALEAARQALALSPEDGRIRDNVAFLAG